MTLSDQHSGHQGQLLICGLKEATLMASLYVLFLSFLILVRSDVNCNAVVRTCSLPSVSDSE